MTMDKAESLPALLARPDWVLHLPPAPEPTLEGGFVTYKWEEGQKVKEFNELHSDPQQAFEVALPLLKRLMSEVQQQLHSPDDRFVDCICLDEVRIPEDFLEKGILTPITLERMNQGAAIGQSYLQSLRDGSANRELEAVILKSCLHYRSGAFRWRTDLCLHLRELNLSGCRLKSQVLEPLSKFIDGNESLVELVLCENNIWEDVPLAVQFARSIKRSVLRNLNLASITLAPRVDVVEAFLNNLSSTNLRELSIHRAVTWGWARMQPGEVERYCVAVSAFLRRSIVTPSHVFGSQPSTIRAADSRGCPNLAVFIPNGEETPDMVHTIMASKLGSLAKHNVRFEEVKLLELPLREGDWCCMPNLTTDVVFGPCERVREFNDAQIDMKNSHWETIARATSHVTYDDLDGAPPGYSPREDSVMKDAAVFKEAFAQYKAKDPGQVKSGATLTPIEPSIHDTAFKMLAAARVTGLNVRPAGKTEQKLPGWLRLPAEIRTACLRAMDHAGCLSSQQVDSILSFATDRRTIGYGRCNEAVLLPVRIHQENTMSNASRSGTSLLLVPEWSFKVALQTFRPWDCRKSAWDDGYDWRTRQIVVDKKTPEALAFLGVTDCTSARIFSPLHCPPVWSFGFKNCQR